MLPKISVLVLSVLARIACALDKNSNSEDEFSRRYSLPVGPPMQYTPNSYPIGVDPQFQFNYVPNKQYFPGGQPPIIFYGGAGLPGQQFLYRPVSPPPGNFLIPQPGPGVMFGNPQTPVFTAGYPKPAHIPPIEKDAEEVPNLAGNHPPTRTGRPDVTSPSPLRPQKIETLDEVESGEETDLEKAEKIPNNFFPKKTFPNSPVLKPGQQFFILNGNTLFSNVPLHQQPVSQHPYQRSFPWFGNQIKTEQPEQVSVQPIQKSENYVSLNNLADFKQDPLHPAPLIIQEPQTQAPLSPYILSSNPEEEFRLGRNFHFDSPSTPFNTYYQPAPYPYVLIYDYNQKEDDDTVTIDARTGEEEEEKKAEGETPPTSTTEEPSISQAKPSALALSGTGGVASAGPRGTALVGNRGLAVASPEATAVAGPTKEESEKKSKPKKEKQ